MTELLDRTTTETGEDSATTPTPPWTLPARNRGSRTAAGRGAWVGSALGLLAAAFGMGVGELSAGVTKTASPVVSVGNTVIDHAPRPVKEFAIRTFGTADKQALIIGILVVVALYAAFVGRLARRHITVGLLGTVAFGAVAVVSATTGRTGEGSNAVPAIVATVAAGAALWLLTTLASTDTSTHDSALASSPPVGPSGERTVGGRRALLMLSAATVASAGVAAVGGRRLMNRRSGKVAKVRQAVALPVPTRELPPVLSAAQAPVKGVSPFVTPNKDFYRIDTALFTPRVDVKDWKLGVTGLVDRELSLTYDDLLGRDDLVEQDCTIMCVSNEIGGDLIGNARWLGVPLANLLREAGLQKDATQIVGVSVDGWTGGFRTELALDGRAALVAIGMNGEPLPVPHGYPARLVVPGIYGYVSATKWLKEIRLTPWEEFDGYWMDKGWSKEGPIKTGSRIDVPRSGTDLVVGRTAIAGVAWAQHRGITKVEVQVDDGPWRMATLAADGGLDTWRQWWIEWDATPGRHELRVRATDVTGATQTGERRPVAPDGATGWHSVRVDVKRP